VPDTFTNLATAILNFLNFWYFNCSNAHEGQTASPCHRYYHCWDMAIFWFFGDDSRPPSGICDACVWTTQEGHLVVFITMQNLAGIDEIALIIYMCFDFASLAWKRLLMPPKWGVLGILSIKWRAISTKPKTAHPCASPRCLSHHNAKIHRPV